MKLRDLILKLQEAQSACGEDVEVEIEGLGGSSSEIDFDYGVTWTAKQVRTVVYENGSLKSDTMENNSIVSIHCRLGN